MNCRTCRFELSLCLDGRLPSGRRAMVMQHVARCDACATFQAELQAAQELALQLPRLAVGADFKTQLWERIRAGEGTPEAVFHEPIPLWTKVRYVATGAAAAAALLLLATQWRASDDRPTAAQPVADAAPLPPAGAATGPASGRVADLSATPIGSTAATTAMTDAPRSEAARNSEAARFERWLSLGGPFAAATPGATMLSHVQPLTADLVAQEAAEQFQDSLLTADRYAARFASGERIPLHSPEARMLQRNASEVQCLGTVLLDLRDQDHVLFAPDIDRELRHVVDELGNAFRDPGDPAAALPRIASVVRDARSLRSLPQEMRIVRRIGGTHDVDQIARLFQQRGDVLERLFVVLPGDSDIDALDPTQRQGMFLFQTNCGPNWVVPLRKAKQAEIRLQVFTRGNGDATPGQAMPGPATRPGSGGPGSDGALRPRTTNADGTASRQD